MIDRALYGRSQGARVVALALAASGLLAVGCGDSNSGGSGSLGPVDKFLGHWSIDSPNSTFTLNCPMAQIAGMFANWLELQFDHGVLTDATELSHSCLPPNYITGATGINMDVDKAGTKLSIVNPDPYAGTVPTCAVSLGANASGASVFLALEFSALDFQLAAVAAGEAPSALLSGTASGPLLQDNGQGALVQVDDCTYSGAGDMFLRLSQP